MKTVKIFFDVSLKFLNIYLSIFLISGCFQPEPLKIYFMMPSTIGGSGGRVIKVTNLNGDGGGSLRDALNQKGPRVIVFEIGGVIDLNEHILEINEPYLTISGETAPSPGITIIKGGILIKNHDIHVSHIRVRPGDAGRKRLSGWQPDGISTYGSDAYNIVIDHCSISWAVDENLSASGPKLGNSSHDILFKDNIIAEGLYNSSHQKGPHSMGTLIHNNVKHVVIVNNLYAHNNQRNPRFKQGASGLIANNIIYNPGSGGVDLGASFSDFIKSEYLFLPTKVNVVGNILLTGLDTNSDFLLIKGSGIVHQKDNLVFPFGAKHLLTASNELVVKKSDVISVKDFKYEQPNVLFYKVINSVGARPWENDVVDDRIIKSICIRSGRIINSQDEVGGYPVMIATKKKLIVPTTRVFDWINLFGNQQTVRNLDSVNCRIN